MYYSVFSGFKPGIYESWNECQKQVSGYKNAKFKKFKSHQNAEYFVQYGTEKPNTQQSINNFFTVSNIENNVVPNKDNTESADNKVSANNHKYLDFIDVYTDGCCINNGKKNIKPKAGYGIYFGENDPRNTNKPIIGKQTNNVAEITAIIETILMLKTEINENKIINIYTDSNYSIQCCSTYGKKLEKLDWNNDKPIPNIELVKKAYNLCKLYKNVKLYHVKAHTGRQDKHSIGNFHADRLANEAVL